MSDFDRTTGLVIDNYTSALQSVEIILSTRIGERVMRRQFGAGVVELLGRLVTPQLFAAFRVLLAAAIDLWEPRFAVRGVYLQGTANELAGGTVRVSIEVDWRPRGHMGDTTVEGVRTFSVGLAAGNLRAFG